MLGALHDRRLREVRRLLRETDDSIEDICGEAGFNDASSLRCLFRQRFGCTMREWRRRNATLVTDGSPACENSPNPGITLTAPLPGQ